MTRVRVAYLDGRRLARVSAVVAGSRERDVARVARLAADEALMGSRGNSGAILAQLVEGFATGVSGARPKRPTSRSFFLLRRRRRNARSRGRGISSRSCAVPASWTLA